MADDDLSLRYRNALPFLAGLPNAVVAIDSLSGRICYANTAACVVSGRTETDLVGRMVEELLPTDRRAAHVGHRTEYMKAPHSRAMGHGLDLRLLHASGEHIPVEVNIGPVVTPDAVYAIAVIWPKA